MKKIFILLLGLLIFSLSFSWEKIPKKDEFGDKTNEYIYVQRFKEGNIVIYWDKDTISKNCVITYKKDYLFKGKYKMKFKTKTVFGDEVVKEIDVSVDKGKIYATEVNAISIINAFKDSDIVKFSIEDKNFRINQDNFNDVYNDRF